MVGMQYDEVGRGKISRQHSETEIPELVDSCCQQMVGVGCAVSSGLSMFFILLSGVSYKFFIDEGVLFWEVSDQDPEEDLIDDENYIDLISYFDVRPTSKLKKIKMFNNVLTISFDDVGLDFVNRCDLTFVERL